MKSHFLFFLILPALSNCKDTGDSLYVATDLTTENMFTRGIEGPATDAKGNIYAVNFQKQSTIGKVSPAGIGELFVELPEGSTGNGIRLDLDGHLLVADYTGHNILRIHSKTKDISVHCHNPKMNQPNDLAIMKNQILFLSDPNWKEGNGNLWRVDTDGTSHLMEADMGTTNGVEVSPDEKTLYVAESVQRKVWAYDISTSGELSNKKLFHEFEDFGLDGMRCDIRGNLYLTRHGKGTVAILSPQGELIREVVLKGELPSNITFGGPDGQTCYVTLQDRGAIEQFRSEFPGREWSWIH